MKKYILVITLILSALASYSQNLLGLSKQQVISFLKEIDYEEYINDNRGITFKVERESDNLYYIFEDSYVCNRYIIENKPEAMTDSDFFILLADNLYEYGFTISPLGDKLKNTTILVLENKEMYALFYPSEIYTKSNGEKEYMAAKVVMFYKKKR